MGDNIPPIPNSGSGGSASRSTTTSRSGYAEYPIQDPPSVRRMRFRRNMNTEDTSQATDRASRESVRKRRRETRRERIRGEAKASARSQSWLANIMRDPTVKRSDDRWTTLVKLSMQIDKLKKIEDLITLDNLRNNVLGNFTKYLKEKTGVTSVSRKVTLQSLIEKVRKNTELTSYEVQTYNNLKKSVEKWLKQDYAQIRKRETLEWNTIKKDFRTNSDDDDWTLLVKLVLKYLWNQSRPDDTNLSKSFQQVELFLKTRLLDTFSELYPNVPDNLKNFEIHHLIFNLKMNYKLIHWNIGEHAFIHWEVYEALKFDLYEDNDKFERDQLFEVKMYEWKEKEWIWEQIHEGIADVYVKPINDIGQGSMILGFRQPTLKYGTGKDLKIYPQRNFRNDTGSVGLLWEEGGTTYALAFKNQYQRDNIRQAIIKILNAIPKKTRAQSRKNRAKELRNRGASARPGNRRPNKKPGKKIPVLGLSTLRF